MLGIGASFLIYLIKFLSFSGSLFFYLFYFSVFLPFRKILRFFFYKVVVRFYGFYLSFLKRIGWSGLRENFFSFLFNQKLVHVFVVFLTTFLIFINLTSKTRADEIGERAKKTMLASLVKSEFSDFIEEEELIIETFDEDVVNISVPQRYLSDTGIGSAVSIGMDDEDGSGDVFSSDTNIVKNEISGGASETPKPVRTSLVDYVVKAGDSISTIAEEFEISVNTILWENNLSAYSVIRPGDTLKILPVNGILHEVKSGESLSFISGKYDVSQAEILSTNKLASASRLSIGQKLIIPGASKIQPATTRTSAKAPSESYTGITAIKNIVTAPSAKPVAGNKMNWPTEGTRISQYYSWRHTGLDIANKTGTPLYAADAGVVEQSGWMNGYGYQVLIDHGGGKKTRYAHASKLFVSAGDKVTKGQSIAAMGSTGWSTGSHIHFEVIINGKKYNPLDYIK